MFEVLVTYPAEHYPAYDSALNKQFGYPAVSGHFDGVRENIWQFDVKEDADKVAAVIEKDYPQCEVDVNY
jgi:hypothetical protein